MTKLEYMQYVREKLQGYDREFVEEILENYEEHFEAGLKNGRSEEEICEELGNIENLLGDIQDVMGDKDLKTHEIDQFTAIEQPQESYSGIEEIELSLLSMDVQILPSRDGQLHVYLAEGKEKAKYLEESISGNRYFAREKNRSQGKKFLGIAFLIGMNRDEDLKLIVEAPQQMKAVTVKTMSGDLQVRGITAEATVLETMSGDATLREANAAKLEAMSGDVKLQEATAEKLTIKTASGDISLLNAGGREMVVQSTSGDVDWRGAGSENTQITTTSGDVDLMEIDARQLKIKTISGETEIRTSQFDNLNISSTSGDVEGSFFAQNSYVQTVSGDIEIALDRRGKQLCARAKTVSGESNVYGNNRCDAPDAEHYLTAYFSTVSGDIEIR